MVKFVNIEKLFNCNLSIKLVCFVSMLNYSQPSNEHRITILLFIVIARKNLSFESSVGLNNFFYTYEFSSAFI